MAIGTLAAVGLGLAGAGSIIGGISSNKAAGKAADVAENTAAQNNALARDIYGQNQQALSPFMQRGNVAGDAINSLLGLPGQQQQQQPNALAQFAGGQPMYGQTSGMPQEGAMSPEMAAFYEPYLAEYTSQHGKGIKWPELMGAHPFTGQQQQPQAQPGASMTGAVTSQFNPQSAFDNYRNSTGYQFRLGEGMNALNSGYAGAGVLQSGAAMKDAVRYGQDFASGEFGNYLGYLGNQQGVGLSGASALAGVGQNYANNVQANNNSAGTAQANALLAKQNPFANALGMMGGAAFGYGSR